MTDTKKKHAQGHWILAKMGKRVLRPGGLALTQSMIKSLHITTEDHVVELAPGLGLTAQEIVKKQPKSYTGIELDADAIRKLKKKLNNPIVTLTQANATTTGIHTNSATKVFGEAMLSMQNDHQKSKIIKEAHRILRPGGLYSIHELGLQPNTLASGIKVHIQSELAYSRMKEYSGPSKLSQISLHILTTENAYFKCEKYFVLTSSTSWEFALLHKN